MNEWFCGKSHKIGIELLEKGDDEAVVGGSPWYYLLCGWILLRLPQTQTRLTFTFAHRMECMLPPTSTPPCTIFTRIKPCHCQLQTIIWPLVPNPTTKVMNTSLVREQIKYIIWFSILVIKWIIYLNFFILLGCINLRNLHKNSLLYY